MIVPYWDLRKPASQAPRTRATNPARQPASAPSADHYYAGKVTVARTRVDVPMLVLRGDMAESHRLPDRRNSVSVDRQTRRHHAHAHGPRAPAQVARREVGKIDGGGLKPTL
jgi:hypothetical protein